MKSFYKQNCILLALALLTAFANGNQLGKPVSDFYSENDRYIDLLENGTYSYKLPEIHQDFANFIEKTQATKNSPTKKSMSFNKKAPLKTKHKLERVRKAKNNIMRPVTKGKYLKNSSHTSDKVKTLKTFQLEKGKVLKIRMIPNSKMTNDEKMRDNFISYSKCENKSGFLGLVKSVKPKKSDPEVIEAFPIMVTLNLHTISFFLSTRAKSIFNNIKLERVLKITQRFPGTYCFDLVVNHVNKKGQPVEPFSLCAESLEKMNEWIDALDEFKQCQLSANPLTESNKKVLADFSKANELIKNDKPSPKGLQVEELQYSKIDKTYLPDEKRMAEESEISKKMQEIYKSIKLGHLADQQIKRTMSNKLKSAEKFALDVKRKQDLVNAMVRKREEEERQKDTKLISIGHKAQELQILKAAQMRLKKLKVKFGLLSWKS